MRFRLFVAAGMAAVPAVLALVVARLMAGADDALPLLHHLALGIAGSLVLQVIFLRISPNFRSGLLWAAMGFVAFVLAPALALPGSRPGQVPADTAGMLLWLLAVISAAGGLWFIRQSGPGRLAGLVLLALPVLAGLMGGEEAAWLTTPGYGEQPGEGPDIAVRRDLGLNLLFWLLLGVFSVLSARRLQRRMGLNRPPPEGPSQGSPEG